MFLTFLFAACGGVEDTRCANGHTLVYKRTDEATCTTDSREVYYCTVCGGHYYEYIEGTALGHQLENRVCTVCGYKEEIPLDAPEVVREGLLLFTLDKKNEGYTVKIDGASAKGEVVIPATLHTLPVIAIEENGFKDQAGITSIVIPDSITEIAKSAFEGCAGLTSVSLGKGVKTVGERAFHGCTALTEVVMGKSVDKIGEAAFGGCGKLQKLVLPFVGCQKAINYRAYGYDYTFGYIFGKQNYSGAQKVTMQYNKVTNNGTSYASATYYIPASLSYVEVTVGNYQYYDSYDDNFYLEVGAFHNCSMIKELVLAPTITIAQIYATEGLSSLERLIAPGLRSGIYGTMQALREIDCAQTVAYNVKKLTIRGLTAQSELAKYADYDKIEELTLVFAEDVTKVKLEQLSPILDKLTGLMLPSTKTAIEEGVLPALTALKKAALPYEMLAELHMQYLEELTILSDTAYTVPATLFATATNLKSLTLDARVTSFEENAFLGCTQLATVTLDGAGEGLSFDALVGRWLGLGFGGERANPLSHGAALYFAGGDGTHTAEQIVLPAELTAIGAYAFNGCSNLKMLTLGDRITTVGTNAFKNTAALKTVNFVGTLAQWCGIAFEDHEANPVNGAESLLIGGEVLTELGAGLTALTVSPYAFYGYLGLTKAALPEGLVEIGKSAFANCTALVDLSIPATLAEIGAFAFENCVSLFSVTFADTNGWARFESESAVSGTSLAAYTLEDPVRAAECLIATYFDHIFKKVG